MQGRLSPADAFSGGRQNSTAAFAAACGLRGPLRFMVENTESGQSQTFDVVEPFVLIGQGPGCHLRLLHPDVGFRHAYCQVLQGRLYVFDLDTEAGTAWGAGLRLEGVLTPDSRLQIGPFVVRLSRAPAFTCSLQPTADDWQPENEPLENVRLWFENATGRSSHNSLRPLRRQITILGRSNRCHLKLSNSSVSKTHCAIVSTDNAYWVVDLLGRNGTLLNGQPVRFAAVGPDDTICAGRFRMKIRELIRSEAADAAGQDSDDARASQSDTETHIPAQPQLPPLVVQAPPQDSDALAVQIERSRQSLAIHATKLPDTLVPDGARTTSDALILAMMEQFSNLQQQLLTHTQQQMSMLTEMFASLHKAQNDAVMDQLRRIQDISSELNELKARQAVAASDEDDFNSPAPPEAVTADARQLSTPEQSDVTPGEGDGKPGLPTDLEAASQASPQQEPGDFPAAVAAVAESNRPIETTTDEPASVSGVDYESPLDDSDVVPAGGMPPVEAEAEVDAEDGEATSDIVPHIEESSDAMAPAAPGKNARRTRSAVPQRPDGQAHARLTMRISELERERRSHWKKLMQLVGGAQDE